MIQVIVVHGRGTKPTPACKVGYVREVLTESVRRVDTKAGAWLTAHPRTIQLVYYADLSRRLWKQPQEPCAGFRAPIERLYRDSRACPTWLKFRGAMKDLGTDATILLDRFLKRSVRLRLMAEQFADVLYYFRDHAFASLIRQRLQQLLVPALRRHDQVLLIAHSLGSIVAYDVLWKLSHMSEYAWLRERRIEQFVTMGSPLGDRVVREHLLGWRYPQLQGYPSLVRCWDNLSARGDVVCHDAQIADDFRLMRRLGLLERLTDHPHLCTVYRGREGTWNPHKLYGYLILPELGRLVARHVSAFKD